MPTKIKDDDRLARIMSWHVTISGSRQEAKLRALPIVQVEQPAGKEPLYRFFGTHHKRYYIVTSAPQTVMRAFRARGIKASVLGRSAKTRKSTQSRSVFSRF